MGETKPLIPILDVVATEEEIELPAPVLETASLGAKVSKGDIGLPMVEPTILVSKEGMDLIVEESLPREGIAPKTEAGLPTINSKTTTPTVITGEPKVPTVD